MPTSPKTQQQSQRRLEQVRSGRPPLNYSDAAQYLGRTEEHLKRLVAEKRITYIKMSPGRSGRVMFDPDRLDEFIEEHSVPAEA